jgi:hypothetical protein
MKAIGLVCALCLLLVSARAQNIKVTIDNESGKAIIAALSKNKISDAEIERIAALEGNRALINKMTSLGLVDAENVFKRTLGEVIRTGRVSAKDDFRWNNVKSKLPLINLMAERITRDQTALITDLNRLISDYTPPDLQGDVRARLLVGGWSLGFLVDNDPTLNIALEKVDDDYEGLKYLLAHELYHSIEALGDARRKKSLVKMETQPPVNIVNAYILAFNIYNEGAATYVGDFTKIKEPNKFSKAQQLEYERNANRTRQNFALFEALLYRAYHDETADGDQLYSIAFTTSYEEAGYYVGYRMAQIIEQAEGKAALAGFVNKSPLEFFAKYIEIYKTRDVPRAIKFSPAVEKILLDMQSWKDRL